MKRKKILIVNNLLGYYGAENVLINMVNHMDLQKYDITVLTLLESESERLNRNIRYLYIFSRKNGVVSKVKNKIKLEKGYYHLAKKYCSGYDVAIAFKMGECAKLVAHSNALRKYCWIHSNVSEIKEAYSYSFEGIEDEKKSLRHFDSMIAVSNCCAESFKKKYGSDFPVKVIYNPLDEKKIRNMASGEIPENERHLFYGDVPILGTVARIDSQKGIDRLVYIAEKLQNHDIQYRMIIIGDGIDYKKYLKIINEQKLSIHMLGFKTNPYIYMKRFDLFICSSVWESYSIVVNEALVLQVPIISTRCGGPEEVLQYGKYGILTENDKENLYIAVEQFLKDKTNVIKKMENYEKTNLMNRFMEKIDNLLEMN